MPTALAPEASKTPAECPAGFAFTGVQGLTLRSAASHRTACSNIVNHTGADGALVLANLSVGGIGEISVGRTSAMRIWHNTAVDAASPALDLGAATAVDARNNVFARAGLYGIRGTANQLSAPDSNLCFGNASGSCSGCTVTLTAVQGAPLFADPAALDYGLQSASHAIDAGDDLGDDRNRDRAGLYKGSGPDLG